MNKLLIFLCMLLLLNSIVVYAQINEDYKKVLNGVTISVSGSEYAINKENRAAYVSLSESGASGLVTKLQVNNPIEYNNHKISLLNVGNSGAVLIEVDGITETINGPVPTERIHPPIIVDSQYKKVFGNVEISVLGSEYALDKQNRAATLLFDGTDRVSLGVGQVTSFRGANSIRLENVGSSGAVLVDVDGVIDTIDGPASTNSEQKESANNNNEGAMKVIAGVEIEILTTKYSVAKEDRSARLLINGEEFGLRVGESVQVKGKKITLQNVGNSGAVLVDVNGIIDTIDGSTSTNSEQTDFSDTPSIELKPNIKDIIILKDYSSEGELSNLPEPFVSKDGIYNSDTVVVVGSKSDVSDVLGAGDIAAKLQDLSKVKKITVNLLKNTELSDLSKNIIALSSLDVNNNCINPIVEKFIRCNSLDLKPEEVILKFVSYNNKQSLMIIGKTSADVRFATKLFYEFENYKLLGNEVKIRGSLDTGNPIYQSQPEERNDQADNQQTCNIPISNALMYAVSLNPDGICMGGELDDLIVPPAFVDNSNRGIPNLRPKGYLDKDTRMLSCRIPCNIPVKITCLKDFGVSYQGANYEENLVDRSKCQDLPIKKLPTSIPIGPNGECNGCSISDRCLQYGARFVRNDKPVYCDLDTDIRTQKQNRDSCQNDFECLSNSCGNGVCQDINERIVGIERELREQRGLLQRILDFFSRVFGDAE